MQTETKFSNQSQKSRDLGIDRNTSNTCSLIRYAVSVSFKPTGKRYARYDNVIILGETNSPVLGEANL